MLITISSCPICSGTIFNNYLECKDYTASQEDFILTQCNACQFVFTNPRPDTESIGQYYLSDKYISHTGGKQNLTDLLYISVRTIALRWKLKIIKQNSAGKTILDFGCGTGEFLKLMKNRGWDTQGVEPSSAARATAIKNVGEKIYTDLKEIKESTFDSITLWHVLEHVHDLNGVLQNLKLLLKKSGTIFIAVPNFQSDDGQHYKSYWAGYDVPRHLWHFSKNNMKQVLENNGLQITNILPMRMDSFYVSLLSESYNHPNQWKLIAMIKAFTRGLISNAKARKKLNYSSLIYIATKCEN